MYAVEELQNTIWNVVDREIVPALHFIPATTVGAILLGAFDGHRLVGFAYGFPGFEDGERIIHSDMLAVLPDYRSQGLGRRLKLAQRDAALAAGVHRITWTFDPLQSRNAHFNFHRLGVTSDRYLRDFYGKTTSPLHRVGTDRLWVVWDLDRASGPGPRASGDLLISIPRDLSELREAFASAFGDGYVAFDFDRSATAYLLCKRDELLRRGGRR